jgi:hypothetical protein
LRSAQDWTGREVDGVVLGIPTREFPGDEKTEPSGLYIWDGGVPAGEIDDKGDIWAVEAKEGLQPDSRPAKVVAQVGDWKDVVPSKGETRVLKESERELGLLKLDREVKVLEGRLEIQAPKAELEFVVMEKEDGKPDRMPRVRN